MSNKIYVTPKKGLIVLDPVRGMKIPDEGAFVTKSSYIDRRIADGDLSLGKPTKQKTKKSGDK